MINQSQCLTTNLQHKAPQNRDQDQELTTSSKMNAITKTFNLCFLKNIYLKTNQFFIRIKSFYLRTRNMSHILPTEKLKQLDRWKRMKEFEYYRLSIISNPDNYYKYIKHNSNLVRTLNNPNHKANCLKIMI